MGRANHDRFLELLSEAPEGTTSTDILRQMELSQDCVYQWRRRVPGFKEAHNELKRRHGSPYAGRKSQRENADACNAFIDNLRTMILSGDTQRLRERAAERAGISMHTVVAKLNDKNASFDEGFRMRYDEVMGLVTAKVADRADWLAMASADESEANGDTWKSLQARLAWLSRRSPDYIDQSRRVLIHEGGQKIDVNVHHFREIAEGVAERWLAASPQTLELPGQEEEAMDVEFLEVEA